MQSLKKKVSMTHPYTAQLEEDDYDGNEHMIEVEVEGEFKDGKPHGLC